jgi:hypothetical protein
MGKERHRLSALYPGRERAAEAGVATFVASALKQHGREVWFMKPLYVLGVLPVLGFFVGIFIANMVEPLRARDAVRASSKRGRFDVRRNQERSE